MSVAAGYFEVMVRSKCFPEDGGRGCVYVCTLGL